MITRVIAKMITSVISRIFTLYMNFTIFLKMVIFMKIFKNHMLYECVKIQEFTLVIIFCDFPSKMTIQAWKWKFWNFSEFSPTLELYAEFLDRIKIQKTEHYLPDYISTESFNVGSTSSNTSFTNKMTWVQTTLKKARRFRTEVDSLTKFHKLRLGQVR